MDEDKRDAPIRVLVAEHEDVLRAAVCEMIAEQDGLELAAVAVNAGEAIEQARKVKPDVALLDVRIPGGGGPRAAREIGSASPGTRSIALSAHHHRSNVLEMLRSGAVGYLVKEDSPDQIVAAIRAVAGGQSSLSAAIVAELVDELAPDVRPQTAFIRDVANPETRNDLEGSINTRGTLLAHVLLAGEEDRQRIADGIHDDAIQVMTAAGMRAQILRRSIDDPDQLDRLDELERAIHLSILRLRRVILELCRPASLAREGLSVALSAYLDETDETDGTAYRLEDHLRGSVPPELTGLILYRIAQDVLTNIRKHAGAEHASVTLERQDGGFYVRICDDGVLTPESDATRSRHLALAAIRERAELAGGWLRSESPPSGGTTVEFWVSADAGAVGALA
jgi:signal transduction histidine kinase